METGGAAAVGERALQRRVVDLDDAVALAADEELADVLAARRVAADEGVQRIDAVHEPGFDQELERAVHGGWCGLVAFLGELGEDVIRADGFVRAPDDLEHALAHRRELEAARGADFFGRADGTADAGGMIMTAGHAG